MVEKQVNTELLDGLIENAIDFLQRSIDEFKENPKYSVIHFAASVELFLKARLMAEHWTLIVERRQEPDRKNFETGDFQSVTPEQAISLLKKVVGTTFKPNTLAAFKELRKHRNKLVHFHADLTDAATLQKIVKEQCRAWFCLKELLLDEWRLVFLSYSKTLSGVDHKMKQHGEYLAEVYEQRKSEIETLRKRGHEIVRCPVCRYEALGLPPTVGLSEEMCLVCEHFPTVVTVHCPECKAIVHFIDGGDPVECPSCGEVEVGPDEIRSELDESARDHFNYDSWHCSYCDGEDTVILVNGQYLCLDCFAIGRTLGQCDWCSDIFMDFDDSMSWWKGCNHCEGHWDKD